MVNEPSVFELLRFDCNMWATNVVQANEDLKDQPTDTLDIRKFIYE